MSKSECNKYMLPIEVTKRQPLKLIDAYQYEYKIYSDDSESKFTIIKFIDINGLIIGEHMPTKLFTSYDKAAKQVKTATVKAVTEIKSVVDNVADIAVFAVSEVKNDMNKTAGLAENMMGKLKTINLDKINQHKTGIVDKVKKFTSDKLSKTKNSVETKSVETEPNQSVDSETSQQK